MFPTVLVLRGFIQNIQKKCWPLESICGHHRTCPEPPSPQGRFGTCQELCCSGGQEWGEGFSPVSLHPSPQQLYCDKAVIKSCCECCGGDQCNDPASLQGQALNVRSPVKYRGSKGEYRLAGLCTHCNSQHFHWDICPWMLRTRCLGVVTYYCWSLELVSSEGSKLFYHRFKKIPTRLYVHPELLKWKLVLSPCLLPFVGRDVSCNAEWMVCFNVY